MKIPFRKLRGGDGADKRAEELQERFRNSSVPWAGKKSRFRERPFETLSQRIERANRLRDFLIFIGLIGALCVTIYFGAVYKGWTFSQTARHIAAFPDFSTARMLGLAPAKRDLPGYYWRHDADGDGVACEPFSR